MDNGSVIVIVDNNENEPMKENSNINENICDSKNEKKHENNG